jgi:hypothetical protein
MEHYDQRRSIVAVISEQEGMIDMTLSTETKAFDPLDTLLDVTFRRRCPAWNQSCPIDFSRLDRSDLETLVSMVLVEYREGLRAQILRADDTRKKSKERPHTFDVFLRRSNSHRHGGELIVYRPVPGSSGDLAWFDKGGDFQDEVEYESRVASLSGRKISLILSMTRFGTQNVSHTLWRPFS